MQLPWHLGHLETNRAAPIRSGRPDWANWRQLGYIWKLNVVFFKDEVAHFLLLFAYANVLHFYL